jgi:hypothetical protein
MDFYVVVINGEVATVFATEHRERREPAIVREVRALLADEPLIAGRVVGPCQITTSENEIVTEVESCIDGWRL